VALEQLLHLGVHPGALHGAHARQVVLPVAHALPTEQRRQLILIDQLQQCLRVRGPVGAVDGDLADSLLVQQGLHERPGDTKHLGSVDDDHLASLLWIMVLQHLHVSLQHLPRCAVSDHPEAQVLEVHDVQRLVDHPPPHQRAGRRRACHSVLA